MAKSWYKNKKRPPRRAGWRYTVIVKTIPCSFEAAQTNKAFKKWRTSDLIKFVRFLSIFYPRWCYMNVYEYKTTQNGRQLGSFQPRNLPRLARPF
jgi:hypothetical protein